MARALMFLGTHSHAGKSLLTTAFCRILARKGYRVAPFKAQNISNNAGVTPEGGEMGRAQFAQAEAAGIAPHTDMNPVLIKFEGDGRSQIVLNGKALAPMDITNWQDFKQVLRDEVRAAYDRLAARFDVIILEGAGSPAEINLKDGDIVNLRMGRHAQAPCLLIGDIDRGGVFAALAGTVWLLEPDERAQIKGFLMNRFRGDPALLGDGIAQLARKAYGIPTLGIIPYIPDVGIAEEDAVALDGPAAVDSGLETEVDLAVIQWPHIANFDEFDALRSEPGVRVRFVDAPEKLGYPHAVILPGTKATMADLRWMRTRGLDAAVLNVERRGAEIVGICGGFQMLGRHLADLDGIEGPVGEMQGLALLDIQTRFQGEKKTDRVILQLARGDRVGGYEIHMGVTHHLPGAQPLGQVVVRNGLAVMEPSGAQSADGRVWGTYLHDIFAHDNFRHHWLRQLGWQGCGNGMHHLREQAYDRLADVVLSSVDWDRIASLMGI